ncbi:MAG: HNH endonuclease [Deltaproteobacteria bacterium]|nr:MAG: HNH endonuclease [Deltaproteobacteria bacterium]
MLTSHVLILNRSYLPIHITTLKRALVLLYQGVAKAVDEQYAAFDFETWTELAVAAHHEKVGLVNKMIRIPRVILLTTYNRVPTRHVQFSRLNIYLRDGNVCQFCGNKFQRTELNLDHVVPRSKGGKTSWENVVTSCIPCNHRKGGNTPDEAGMKLIRPPARPHWTPFTEMKLRQVQFDAWKPYFNIVDFSYWNLELKQE